MRLLRRLAALCLLLTALRPSSAAGREGPEILPLERIKPGMTGYGLTVFSGFKVERFNVQVIDVLRNFLPKQDLFLVRVDHPLVRKTGVVGGMSGSPIYLEGKLAGALAYGWRFSKEPIAGITPIVNMLDLRKRKLRGPMSAGFASAPLQPGGPAQRLVADSAWRRDRWWKLPTDRTTANAESLLSPVAVPLSAAGFASEALPLLKDAFASYGFEPVQGGGTGQAEGPDRFETGGALGVQLVSGDMALTGTGTVTWVGERQLLGFGHRMFNAGEIYLPAVTARINHTLSSLSRSFKISSPARVLGALTQDRQAGVLINLGQKIDTVPMTVTTQCQGERRVFTARVAHHQLLTPSLATSVFSSALSEAVADVTHTTFKVTTRVKLRGYPTLTLEDYLYAPSGVRLAAVLMSRGLQALRNVMMNPFESAVVERLDIAMDLKFTRDLVEITGLRTDSMTVNPGSRINLIVSFRPFGGAEFTKAYPLDIPVELAGSVLVAEAASGEVVEPELPQPENLRQLLESLQQAYPARSVVISLSVPTQGLKLRGQLLDDLPTSVIDSLNAGTQVRSETQFETVVREVRTTNRVVAGRQRIRIRVRKEVLQ